jgi:uncharacterized protein YecE (DUF72 family)
MPHTDKPHGSLAAGIHLGVAGWSIRREHIDKFSQTGTHLQRYASVFNAVEINSCFYRPHRFSTYERWAASVPDDFRFAVKLPKAITHETRLAGAVPAIDRFLAETAGLGAKRGPILVQLPPSLSFEKDVALVFFRELRDRFEGDVVFEPRHETWFAPEVESMLVDHRVARVAADPARVPARLRSSGVPEAARISADLLLRISRRGAPAHYGVHAGKSGSRDFGVVYL